jgi:hypothetical protein
MTSIIDNIVGIACLPLGVILLFNQFGATHVASLFGLDILLLGALAIVALQFANIVATHIHGEWIVLSYIVHILLLFPAVLYFLSLLIALPAAITTNLPTIMACFILSEGLYSFFF